MTDRRSFDYVAMRKELVFESKDLVKLVKEQLVAERQERVQAKQAEE